MSLILSPYRFSPVVSGDISFAKVRLQLHADGADGSTVITDSSNYARTMTRVGTAEIDTAQSVFGGSSMYIPASTNGWTTPGGPSLDPGAGAFMLDFRFRPTANIANDSDGEIHTILGMIDGTAWDYEWAVLVTSSYFRFYFGRRGTNNKSLRFFFPPGYSFTTRGGMWTAMSIGRDATGRWGAWIEGQRCPDYQQGILGVGESYAARVNGAILTDTVNLGVSTGKLLNVGRFYTYAGLSREKHLDELRFVIGECRDVTANYTPALSPFVDSNAWGNSITSLPNLWGWWRLDETAGAAVVATDGSGNGRHATYNAAGTQVAGLFSGSSSAQATLGARIDVPNWVTPSSPVFTVGAVIKTTHNSGSEQQVFSADGGGGTRTFQFFKNTSTNTMGVTFISPSVVGITGATVVNDGNPHLVVFVYDETLSAAAGRMKIYVDGVLDAQSTTAITLPASLTADLGIGARRGSDSTGLWAGSIDEAFFCTGAASAAQIAAMWAARNS